jgi:hypothetical protein
LIRHVCADVGQFLLQRQQRPLLDRFGGLDLSPEVGLSGPRKSWPCGKTIFEAFEEERLELVPLRARLERFLYRQFGEGIRCAALEAWRAAMYLVVVFSLEPRLGIVADEIPATTYCQKSNRVAQMSQSNQMSVLRELVSLVIRALVLSLNPCRNSVLTFRGSKAADL